MLGISLTDWLVIVVYLFGITFIGSLAARRVTSSASLFMGDRKFGKVMMIFFGFIFYGFASGFMLYIMTSAALGIAESKIIKAQLAREDLELEGKQGGEGTVAPAGPLYKAKNKSAEKIVPSSAKKKKRRKRF